MTTDDRNTAENAAVARGRTYGKLSTKHPEYDADLYQKIEDLYVGGFQIQKHARMYLPVLCNESPERHDERIRSASYQPYFGQIVEQFGSDVFMQPLSVKPAADADNPNTPGEVPDKDFYPAFEKDVDLEGTSFVDLMHDCLVEALKQRFAIVAIDAPADKSPTPPANKAEEQARGNDRIYAYRVPCGQLIDWKTTARGSEYLWAILHKIEQDRESPDDSRDLITETFTVWTLVDGPLAQWQRYQIVYDKKEPPKDEDLVPLEDEGVTSFDKIPLVKFELPMGLWVGNKIGPQAEEHYQRRSIHVAAQNKSMVAIPVLKKGPEVPAPGGAIPAEITQTPSRGNDPVGRFNKQGWFEIGAQDAAEYLEPEGRCYELTSKELEALKDAMFQVNHQMAASIRPTTTALGRSGLSKQKDQDATERVLTTLGHFSRLFSVRIMGRVAQAHGDNDTHWAAHGLDDYGQIDREQLLQESLILDQVAIPSITFKKLHKRAVAEQLLKGKADPETMATIIDEIEDGVDKEDEMRQLQDDAQKDALLNPEPIQKPGVAPVQRPQPAPVTKPQPPPPGGGNRGG